MAKACDFHSSGELVPAQFTVRMNFHSSGGPNASVPTKFVDACHEHREAAIVRATKMYHTAGTELHVVIRCLSKPGGED